MVLCKAANAKIGLGRQPCGAVISVDYHVKKVGYPRTKLSAAVCCQRRVGKNTWAVGALIEQERRTAHVATLSARVMIVKYRERGSCQQCF